MDQGVDQAPINPMSLLRTDLFQETQQHLKIALSASTCPGFSFVQKSLGPLDNIIASCIMNQEDAALPCSWNLPGHSN